MSALPSAMGSTLVAQVMQGIQSRIDGRRLMPGARLPSVRACAETMGVSKSTVVDAYERLVAEGAIVARRGSGFYVAGVTRPLSLKAISPQRDRAIDPLWLTRQSLQAGPDALKPGSGWLPASWMPDAALQRSLRLVARDPVARRMHYDEPLGFAPLRQRLAQRLRERDLSVDADQIIVTDSGSQSLDLLCRFLLEPGDVVLIDDPCYFNFRALLQAQRITMVGVPRTPTGPDIKSLAEAAEKHSPRFYLTNSGPHNPTGATLSSVCAHQILKIAELNDMLIVEDEVFADLEHETTPRLASFDGLDRVIQIGSFSKTVSAASRCGYIATRAAWIEPLVDLKLAIGLGNSQLSAVLLHHLLTDGTYRRHLDGLRTKLADAMGRTLQQLASLAIEPFIEPRSGLFVWARLPEEIDAADVARLALAENVIFAPGNVFSISHSASGYMRFNVARCDQPPIFDVLARTMERASRQRSGMSETC